MTGMGRPPLWFYTTTHGPRTKESQVSQPRGRGAGQWPAAGGATHSTHSTQRKRARARARWGSPTHSTRPTPHTQPHPGVALRAYCRCSERGRVALRVLGLLATVIAARSKQAERATKKRHAHDKNETRQRRGGDRKDAAETANATKEGRAQRGVRTRDARHACRKQTRARGWHAEREGAASQQARWWSGVVRREATTGTPPPPRAKTHIPRTVHDLLDCGGDNHRGDLARGHHMPPALRSLAPCGTADSEAQLASRSSQLAQLAPRRFASEAPPAAGSRAGASTARSEQS